MSAETLQPSINNYGSEETAHLLDGHTLDVGQADCAKRLEHQELIAHTSFCCMIAYGRREKVLRHSISLSLSIR